MNKNEQTVFYLTVVLTILNIAVSVVSLITMSMKTNSEVDIDYERQ